jgi:multidrug resistance protein
MSTQAKASRLVIFVIVFVDLLGFGIMIPMLPFYARSLGADATQVGALMFVYSFMQIFVSPLWGSLSDRFGRRPILLVTILFQGLAFFWAAMSTTYWSLLLSRVAAGIFAANISTASAYMADVTPREERAKGMGLIGAAFGLGFIFGPAVGGLLLKYGHWAPSMAAGVVCVLNFILAMMILAEPRDRKPTEKKFSFGRMKFALERPDLFFPMLTFFLITLAFVQMEITFGLFVVDRFGLAETDVGFLLAFMGVMMAIIQGGLLGPLTRTFQEYRLIGFGLIGGVIALSALAMNQHFWVFVALLAVLAVSYSLMNPCLSALASKSASDDEQGSTLGIFQSAGSLARVIAPLLAGFLYDVRASFPLLCGAALIALGAFSWFIYVKKRAVKML